MTFQVHTIGDAPPASKPLLKKLSNYANNLAHAPVDDAFKAEQLRENRAN